jgi:4-diphosphocytidyl-2-C-methyl-D-erythritol kinase
MPEERTATLRAFAKINLDLRVLYRRSDNFHELRTIFQTISLADTLHVRYVRARRTRVTVEANVDIPNNLVLRAAEAVLETAGVTANVTFNLDKRIPMGAGLGGGSSNAAAVLLALPILAGAPIPLATLVELGATLGSDVPFFLYGGTALGIGRGTELYPLPDVPARHGLLIAPDVHVSTAEAYRDLNHPQLIGESGRLATYPLTIGAPDADTEAFRSLVWALAEPGPSEDWKMLCTNDFEEAVFKNHSVLPSIKRKLVESGARPALMTGSGSALFGLFDSPGEVRSAVQVFRSGTFAGQVSRIALLTRRRYRSFWRQQLSEHIGSEVLWPPRSLYLKP